MNESSDIHLLQGADVYPLEDRSHSEHHSEHLEASPAGNFNFGPPQTPNDQKSGSRAPSSTSSPQRSSRAQSPNERRGKSKTLYAPIQRAWVKTSNKWEIWKLELISLLVSTVALLALCVLLYRCDGQPLAAWDAVITLNTVVAGIATLSRVVLLVPVAAVTSQAVWLHFSEVNARKRRCRLTDLTAFDEASRGAWGSIKLLWRLKKQMTWVHLGAVILILILGFDVFVQQVLSNKTVTLASRGFSAENYQQVGIVPRATTYYDLDQSGEAAGGYFDPAANMTAAINAGIWGAPTKEIVLTCSSNNCTWPIIPTMAFEGECHQQNDYNFSCAVGDQSNYSDSANQSCLITAGSGISLHYLKTTPATGEYAGAEDGNLSTFNISTTNQDAASYFFNGTASSFSLISFGWGAESSFFAAQCTLKLCVQSLSISSVNSSTTSSVRRTWYPTYDQVNPTLSFEHPPDDMNIFSSEKYIIDLSMLNSIATNIAAGTIGSYTMVTTDGSYLGPTISSPWIRYMKEVFTDMSNLNTWITNFADQLTYIVRMESQSGNSIDDIVSTINGNTTSDQYYAGTAHVKSVIYHVRWWWMLYPAVLIIMSTIYTLLGIIYSHRHNIGPWKGNPLYVLFMQPPSHLSAVIGEHEMMEVSLLEKAVGQSQVWLDIEDSGVRFSEAE